MKSLDLAILEIVLFFFLLLFWFMCILNDLWNINFIDEIAMYK